MAVCYSSKSQKMFEFKLNLDCITEVDDSCNFTLLYYKDSKLNDRLEDVVFKIAEEMGIVIPNLENIETTIIIEKNNFNLAVTVYPLFEFENVDLLSKVCKDNIRNFYLYKKENNSRIYCLDFTEIEQQKIQKIINY